MSYASVVIPCYNEAATVEIVVRSALSREEAKEIIVVDDGSRDNTWSLLQASFENNRRIKLIRHTKNLGKGAALRSGFAHVTSPIVIVQDADLEYSPADYGKLLEPILLNVAEVVFGSRFPVRGWRSSSCAVLLAFCRQQNDHNVFKHVHKSEPH